MDRRRAAAALLALAACIACSAAAPTAGNHTALELHDGPVEGCYYNFQHYGEGDRIMTNEPCLNCTCHNRMLMCYLRVCPFTKAIGQDCTVEKRADQCCPIVTCPDVPVDLLTSTSTSSPAEYGATGLGKLDKYGCSIHGKYFPEGAKVPPTPNKPCEHCYCIRNMTTCVMQECTLHVDGCTPIYHKDVCCPVRYSCDHPEDEIPLLDDMTTTVRPTPGFLLTTTTTSPITQMSQDCVHDDQIFPDGALIKTEKACEHCYCMKGDIVCVVQECGTPMENEGKNCTSLPPRHGQCCPDTYICEGDELVTDATTEFFELTSSPPRRVGIEGSGYRKETDELYTETSPVASEMEGSGEGFATGSQTDTGEYVTPEKEVIDETLLTTTERTLHLSQSTEPDKGQNTIPDSVIDKETAKEPLQEEVTISDIGEYVTTASEQYTTARYLTSQREELSTTESVIKINDESISDETLTPTEEERKTTTESTDLLDKTTPLNEIILHTNPIIIELDEKATISPSTEYTIKVKEISEQEGLSTEILVESSVTEKNKFTDVFQISSDTELEPTTIKPVTNLVVAESTSVNPNINEIDDSTSPALVPSRIPGEGDCLLNGITYANNTNVPSINNCHTGCKCMSSIIKCDPIICSPPPEYMENMNDCQPIYDTPNSCCPTYVCNVKETIPPESHSHMSGTESPKPMAPNECSGHGCLDNEDKKMPMEPTSCSSGDCLSESSTLQQECKSNNCKDQLETTPSIPSQDGIGVPCEGENCKTELLEKESETTKTPALQQKCESDDCKDQVQEISSISLPDCSDGKCEISPETSCEGESCKIHPPIETVHDKDLEPSSHDVPPKICNGETGCDENNIIGPEECVGEICRRKEYTEVGAKGSSICSGADCKQHDEPTVQSTEKVSEMVTEESTDKDVNQENLDTIQSHITTAKITLSESDLDLTKQPTYMESTEKLSTSFEQIVTEPPKKYDTEKETVQTDDPLIHTVTDINSESITEAVQTESPKLSDTETKEPQETVSHTDERLTTEINLPYTTPSEYLETETKEFLPGEDEYLSTEKAHIYTGPQDHGTVIDEEHTKLPEFSASELENPTTKAPESVILEKDGRSTESPETINKKEDFVTKPPGTSESEKETIYFEATETSIPVTEVGTQSGTSEAVTEKEIKETKSPELLTTEKGQLHTEVTETIIDREDTHTQAPEIFATDKEVTVDKEIIQTGTEETSFTGSPEIIDVGKETVQYVSPDVTITTKEPTKIEESMFTKGLQTLAPDTTVTKTDEVLSEITERATEEEGIKLSTPDLHDMKVESTTPRESSEEEQTMISFNPITGEAESYVTNPQATITNKPEITEEKEYGESYKPKPTKHEDTLTEAITEIVTELIASDVTEKIHVGVTESISQPTFSEIIDETATKETHKVTTEEQEMFTKSPQEIVFNASTEKEASTDKDLLYTSKPDVYETKHDDVSQAIDQSDTESHVTTTNEPDVFTSHYSEPSTVHDAIVTDKYKESPDTDKKSTLMPIHEITHEQEKYTEAPERYSTESQAQDESTKLLDLYTTLAEEISIPQKSTDKPHETPSSDLEKNDDDKTDKVHETTLIDIEKIITTESSKFITVTPVSFTEPQTQPSTDQKIDSESPHLITKTEDSDKEPESSTDIFEHVTDMSKTHTKHPEFIEEIEKDLTTKITEYDIATEAYKTTSDNLLSQTAYKDELHTEPQQTISQDTSYTIAVSEPYVETSTKTNVEKEKEKQDQETTTQSQTTQSKDEDEFESTLSFIKTSKPEFVTEKDAVEYTTKDGIKETPYDTEKHDSKPFITDEKPSYTTEVTGFMGAHYPEHTDMDSLTTQTSLPYVENANNNVLDSNEISTKSPESITMLEQNTLDIKDTVTTESHVSHTSSEDKLSTIVSDTKEIQKEQESYTDDSLTTFISLQPEDYKKVTELPMSQVTHTDHDSSPQTTLSTKGDIAEQASKTTIGPKLEEEKTQTTMFEVQKQSTETPDHHITQQEIEPASNLGVDHEEKMTTSIIEDEYSTDEKTTLIPQQQTGFSKDVPTVETVSGLYNQNTEVTPDQKEVVVVDTQPQTTTTGVLPMEKEPDITHEQETPSTVSVTGMVTKLTHETQTVLEDITVTPSVLRDDEHVKETMATAGISTEQHGLVTQYPEINVHDMYSTLPEKVYSESEGSTDIEATKISVDKESESATSASVPTVTEPTEISIPVAPEISEPDITEKDHQPTEIEEKLEDKTTTQIYLDEVTEKDISYTQSKPLYTTEVQNVATQQKEITTEALDRTTIVPDQAITQSLFTEKPESDDHYGITDSVDKNKNDERIPSQSTTQILEIITEETLSEKEQPTLTETVKETESQPEKTSTQPTIEKELLTTEATTDSNKESDKEMVDVHNISTEFTPTTLASSYTKTQPAQTQNEFNKSEEPKQTTEPGHKISETTPFLVELKEHTHEVIDDSSRTPIEEILTTSLYEPQQTERGDQSLDVTDKYEEEYQTSVPITVAEDVQEDKEKPVTHSHEQAEEKVPTTTSAVKDFTDHISDTGIVSTTSPSYLETDLQEKEKNYTTTVQDVVLTTSAAPQIVSETEFYTTITTDVKNLTYPETSSMSEKDINLVTEEPLKSEITFGTTMSDEELLRETLKSTTSNIKEESTTHSPLPGKSTPPEEKPIKPTPSPPTQELTKPAFDDEINEGIPSPDFPPSGTGGYGQEPDYIEEDQAFGPGTCRYGGKVYVSAQQIPRDDPCDFCFCFRSDIICLQQSCPPPIHGCHEEPIQGFCCPRYECPVSMATTLNVTTTTTTTTTTLPPHFLPHAYKGAAQRRGCQIKGHTYKVGEVVRASSGPCLHCTCGGDGQMKCDPKACTPEPMLRQMIAAAVSAKRRR